MKLKKLLIAAIAGTLLISGCSSSKGTTAVQVGDSVITDNEIKFALDQLMSSGDVSIAVDSLEQSFRLKEIAEKMNITLDDEETLSVKKEIASFKANLGGKKEGDKLLKQYGVDDDILSVLISSSMYSQKIFEQIDVGQDPTDDELRQYFKDSFLRAKHVLVSTTDKVTGEEDLSEEAAAQAETTANEVLEKAKNGEDFDTLIENYNEDPGMESNEDGYFFTDKQMVTEFEEATKSIQPGEFTICKSSYGYHIIQRLPIEGENFEKFFEDNKSSIQSAYVSLQEQKVLDAKAEELGIKIDVKQDVIDEIQTEKDAANN